VERVTNDARAGKGREAVHFTFVPSSVANNADHDPLPHLDIPLDVVVYSEWTKSLSEVAAEIKGALVRQLEHAVWLLLQEGNEPRRIIPTPFHFKLNNFGTLVTIIYPLLETTGDSVISKQEEESLGETELDWI